MTKIVCISLDGLSEQTLTLNKIYITNDNFYGDLYYIHVIGDNNIKLIYLKNRFITLEEYRNNKLNIILNG